METGTYRGDTLAVVRPHVDRAISIELDPTLAARAKNRFARYPNVEIIEGDSATVLPGVISRLDGRALFWLDGHYSSGVTAHGEQSTPIAEELRAVLDRSQPDHIVLIDDARLFVSDPAYPSLTWVRELVQDLRPNVLFGVADDIIRIHAFDVR